MKICFLSGSMDSGGAERVISILANNFIDKYEIEIITWGANKSFYELNEKIIHHRLGVVNDKGGYHSQFYFNALRIFALKKSLQKIKPDVLISFIVSNNVLAIVAAALTKTPVIISERSELFTNKIPHIWFKLRKLLYKYADALVLQTDECNNLINLHKLQAKSNIVIPNPIKIDNAFLPKKENVILFVGRLTTEKRICDLLVAFRHLVKNESNYVLWVVGEGEELNSLLQLAADLDILNNVVFYGAQRSVKEFYQKAKIFVLPSVSEGFPNVLIEAMNYKNVVISSNCSMGPKEIIDHGISGFLYEPQNVDQLTEILIEVSENYANYKNMITSASEKLLNFSDVAISNKWIECIESVKREIKKY